ncbi:unnamed protein product [Larinioides sclopetarius]|uniref:Death-inducer obliterator 1 n=1 Tax=Larinioides sclopetarius TaxID=280406 RepID=A0AAV2AWI4_9ARAC
MNMTTEKSKNLLMNVSKDEMDTIDEILQSRQSEMIPDKKTGKLPVASRSFISGSPKLNFPISVLIQASGVLNELNAIRKQNETGAESAASDDGNDVDGNFSYEKTPESLEDLILLEHNYAVKYFPILKSKETDNALEDEAQEKCDTKEVSESSSIPEVSESSTISEVPESTSISEVPESSSISEVPESSSISEVPESCSISEVPKSSSISEVPKSSSISEVPRSSSIPEVPESSSISEVSKTISISKAPEISGISKVPEITSISKVPETSSISAVPEVSSISKVPKISSISEVPEVCTISPPVRRSKRQIEKLERELVAAANVDLLDHEVPKEKLVKNEEKKLDDKDTKSLKIESNMNSDIKVSNYKSFAEFKKRHLKVVVEDCKNMKTESEFVPVVLSKSTEEILHDSVDNKCKNDSAINDKDIPNSKHPEPQAKSKYLRKTKIHKSADVESDEKSNVHSPHVKKKKYLNLIPNSNDSAPKQSPECEEKSDKSVNKNVFKDKKNNIEHIKQKNHTHLGKKRKKHASSSEKLPSNPDVHQVTDSPVSKRKKCVSFSEDLLLSDKPEAIPRKQRISSDSKESHQKGAVSSPVISTTPIPKVHKKKILRRDSLRLINDDGPALFSQPDVMIKVSTDDNANKKDEKETDSSDRLNKMKTTDMIAVKNSLKENQEIKEKQMLKDKSDNNKLSMKTKPEKEETIKVMLEERDKQSSKLKQEDKGKQSLKQQDKGKQALKLEDNGKQVLKQGEKEKQAFKEDNEKQDDKEQQALKQEDKEKEESKQGKQELKVKNKEEERQIKQGKKERQILNQDEKEKQVLKQNESKLNHEENQTPKILEEKLTEEHLEEKPTEEYGEENQEEIEKHDEEKLVCNDENNYDHQIKFSDNLQDTEREFEQQEMQHSYNNFTNIEAFLESSKFHATVQEVEENDSEDLKCIGEFTVEAPENVTDNKSSPKGALKHDSDEKPVESISNSESESRMLPLTRNNEEPKLIPERKSRRLIKKKEFFGYTSDSSDSKRVSAAKNKRTNVDKPTARGRRSNVKNKNVSRNEDRNGHLEEDISTDQDSSEEDDPKKLWCICRKPHNSRFMIQCDKCEDWFHGSCVGVTKQYGRQLEKQKKEWNCPNCRLKGESSPQKAEKSSKQAADIESPNEKNSKTDLEDELDNRKKPLLHNMNMLNSTNLENNKMPIPDVKNLHSLAVDQLPSNEISLKKEKAHSNLVEKSDKISKVKVLKQLSQQKSPAASKQNLSSNLKTPNDSLKLSSSSKQSSFTNAKSDVSPKSPVLPKQPLSNSQNASPNKKTNTVKAVSRISGKSTSVFLDPKRKLTNALKEKDEVIKKKQSCVNCQSEARANSCYCSDECIEKYAALFLKTLQNKGNLKGPEFDSQRLIVLNRLNGNLINDHGPTAGEIVSWLKSNPSFIITGSSNTSSSTKKDASSQKKEAESSSSSERKDSTDESAKTTIRLNVRKTLKNILLERCKKADDLEMSEDDVQKIAVKIEEELNALFKDNSFKYRAKYRSLMFNIKDPRNQGLFRKILKGNIPPDRLVRMTPEELASMELAKWREQENQHLLDMIKRVQLEQQKSGSGLLLKKTHKGEVEIEDDLTSIIEQDIPKNVLKDVPEDLVEPEKEEVKDSTHLHRSHLFDLNCKICTGKIVPPPVDENVPKKVRVAHSISVDLGSPNASEIVEKSVPKVVDGKSPVSNAGDDSMDQVPTSTVSIESPEINAKSTLKDTPSKTLSSVWKGFIFMQDIAKFVTSAYKVSGPTDHLQADLPDTIQVCGRIVPDQVWDYLGKIKQSGNKELVIIRFQAANEEEAVTYHSFYSYLSSRKRYGVVSNYSKKIKDFYLLPLASTSPVPMVLVPFAGPGLPSPRPHLLLGVIVRHKSKQVLLPVVPRQLPSSKAEVEIIDDSYTPPHEPRSYTPPLPTLSTLEEPKEQEEKSVVSPNSVEKEDLNTYKSPLRVSDLSMEKSKTLSSDKASISDAPPFEKDDDKPYDPEQDILNIPSETPKAQKGDFSLADGKERSTVNLEQQKKILDALSRQVEETENALKQLISQPEDDAIVQSPNAPSLDINSVAETGMSSFLDLPENLQEILNAVRLKTYDKEIGDVDMRIKTLFGKHFNEQKNVTQNSEILRGSNNSSKAQETLEEVYSPQAATPPLNDEDMDRSTISCPSDPRIKLRTSFQDVSFISKDTFSSSTSLNNMSVPDVTTKPQNQLPVETEIPTSKLKSTNSATMPPNILLAGWNSGKEPPPPGIEPTESPSQEGLSIQASPHTSVPQVYPATVQDTSQHVNSAFYPQSFSSFQPGLPLGFSVHTPPPNIKHFPPPPIISTSFPPPPPLPIHVVSPQATDNNLVKDQWPALQPPGNQTEGSEWHAGSSHWKEAADHQGNQGEGDSRYYSSDRSNDYGNDNFYKRDSSNRHWDRPRRFAHGHWVKNPSRGRYTNQRRGKRGPSFRRNLRN